MKMILILFCLISIVVKSQTPSFSKVFYDSALNDLFLNDVTATLDSSFLILTEPAGLIKINAEGDRLWTKGFKGENYVNTNYNHLQFQSIAATDDSCFLIGGFTIDSITNKREAVYLKLDSEGDTIWSGAIYDSIYELSINSIEALKDSGAIVLGTASLQSSTDKKSVIARVSKTGALLWSKSIASSVAYVVRESADSSFIIGGDFGLIKFDSSGDVLWANDYIGDNGSSFNHAVNDLIPLNDGYMVYFALDYSVVIAKLNFSGLVVWAKSYSASPFPHFLDKRHVINKLNDSFIVSMGEDRYMKIDSLGTILSSHFVAMNARAYVAFGNDGYFFGEGPVYGVKTPALYVRHIGVVKIDTNNLTFFCGHENNISSSAKVITVIPFLDSTIALGMSTYSAIDTLSFLINERTGCVEFIGVIDENTINLISIYPNPSNGSFTVNKELNEKMTIYFYNTLGELIYTERLLQNDNRIYLSNVKSGIYFYRVVTKSSYSSSGKVIIE